LRKSVVRSPAFAYAPVARIGFQFKKPSPRNRRCGSDVGPGEQSATCSAAARPVSAAGTVPPPSALPWAADRRRDGFRCEYCANGPRKSRRVESRARPPRRVWRHASRSVGRWRTSDRRGDFKRNRGIENGKGLSFSIPRRPGSLLVGHRIPSCQIMKRRSILVTTFWFRDFSETRAGPRLTNGVGRGE